MNKSQHKVAWVTGASSGIGRAVALRLAKDGWRVAATARREGELARLVGEAKDFAGTILQIPADVTDGAAMKKAVSTIEQTLGPIDLAILNAGTYFPDTAEDFKAETLEKQFTVNVFGTAHCVEALLPPMRERKAGHIAIVASVAGYRGLPRSLSYGSSKAALNNFAEALAIETRDAGLKVQVVNPGFIKTPLTDKNDFPMPMLMDVDLAADKLVKGLKSGRFEITFPWLFCAMTKMIGRLLPSRLYFAAMARMKDARS